MKLSKELIKQICELWKLENKSEVKHEDIEGLGKLLFKLNYSIEPIRNVPDKIALERKVLPGLIKYISDFVANEVKHPPKVAASFPCDELAARLVKVYGVKGAE